MQNLVADTTPGKEFFIDMLTRDISLEMAILELIDNSIDAAIAQRGKDRLNGYEIRVEFNDKHFRIKDNCGGITIEDAESFVFRIGRPSTRGSVDYSVGRFGVGMKRAIFKMGRHFSVVSDTLNTRIEVRLDIDAWKLVDENWDIPMNAFENIENKDDQIGTIINIHRLHEGVQSKFLESTFTRVICDEISKRQERALSRGVKIYVNDINVAGKTPTFLVSNEILPAHESFVENGVSIKIYSGIDKFGSPSEAGWYVYCNDRLIIKADQSKVTGWGEDKVANFHVEFAGFRGYVYLESIKPELLPWNTSKTGIDAEHAVFRAAKKVMNKHTKNIIPFLRKIKADKDEKDPNSYQYKITNVCIEKSVYELDIRKLVDTMKIPPRKIIKDQETISFQRPKKIIQLLKDRLSVGSNGEVGGRVFDDFVTRNKIK